MFIEAKDDGSGGDTGAISCAKLQSNHHHQKTNTQVFTGQMAFLSPNQQCQSTEGKKAVDRVIPINFGRKVFQTEAVATVRACLHA